MSSKNYLGLLGSVMVIGGAFSPMLRMPIIGNWNYWDIEPVLASIVLVFAGLGLIGSSFEKPALVRFSGWAVLAVTVFTLIAVHFKVNDYFSFIPLKKLAAAAASIVKYKWLGWGTIGAGSLIMILAGRRSKKIVS